MDSVFECGLCSCLYDEFTHKPLSLPCGHVFCSDCLSKQSKDFLLCPIDKFIFDVEFYSLPCCYAILANLPKFAQKDSCCVRHPKKKVKFLCKSHDKFLCTECVVEHTGAGHNITAFTVNTSVVKTELKELENVCDSAIRENESLWKDIEIKHKSIKDYYHGQINKISSVYENALKTLQQKKKEQIGLVSKYLADQCKAVEKQKEKISRALEGASKVFSQVQSLQSNLPHYESLCLTIKSLKQELKYLESPIDQLNVKFYGFKASDPVVIGFGNLEDIDDNSEAENITPKNKPKTCSNLCKPVLQNSCLNENASKTPVSKANDKSTCKPEEKSPEKDGKSSKNRQNMHPRSHPKRMPWKKRNKSL